MAYQIAKEIGAASTVLAGEVEAIILTGELAYQKKLTNEITNKSGLDRRCLYPPRGK